MVHVIKDPSNNFSVRRSFGFATVPVIFLESHKYLSSVIVAPQRWHLPNIIVMFIGPWWRHQMETFSALLAICGGNSPVTGEFPAQRPVTRSYDAFLDLRLNNRLSKQSWGWWIETPLYPLWRHCNGNGYFDGSEELRKQGKMAV